MSGYLGYDRCALGILLGALAEVGSEHPRGWGPHRALSSPAAARVLEAACGAHRRCVATLTGFAEPIAAILRGDPLGRYPAVVLDPADLSLWGVHRGGGWSTVTDPTDAGPGWTRAFVARNARLVAADLGPDRLRELLNGPASGLAPLLAYLGSLRGDAAAGHAFLSALGPEGFAALVRTASDHFIAHHLPGGTDHPTAARADAALLGLGGVWAASRAAGHRRDRTWNTAALGGTLYGSARLLGAAAHTPGALSTTELAEWGGALWGRLSTMIGLPDLPQPELIGDLVLGAVSVDGRAARRMILGLTPRDRVALLTNGASTPAVSGALLVASTDPGTVAGANEEDEVRRSVQVVARTMDDLLAHGRAGFPAVGGDSVPLFGRVLPLGLGRYFGGQLDHLVDPCDGARSSPCPVPSRAWDGWHEREVAGLLTRLVADPAVAADLHDAAWSGAHERLRIADLTSPRGAELVENEAFVLGALGGILRTSGMAGAIADWEGFQRRAAAVNLAVDVAATAWSGVGPVAAATSAWGGASDLAGTTGLPSPAEVALAPFRPESVRRALAESKADEAVEVAALKNLVGAEALSQLHQNRLLVGTPPVPTVPTEPDGQVRALLAASGPGSNANAPGWSYSADLERWISAADGTGPAGGAGATVGHLVATAGDAEAQGSRWAV